MMIENRRLTLNALASVLQTILIGVTYFFLYKYLLKVLGAEKLGLWSLVAATTSVANLANLGITSSIVKFISANLANNNIKKAVEVIHTSLVTVGGLMLLIALLLLSIVAVNIQHFVPPAAVAEARQLLPIALASLILNTIGAIFLSVLDGMELIYLRAAIYIFSSILFLILSFFIVPKFGLTGVLYAQIIQGLFVLVLAIVIVYMRLSGFSFFPFLITKATFKELFKYGLNFQIISISSLLFDPITKFCLSSFGGLTLVGYFEMASRLIMQVRSLIVSANQAIVPLVARKNETGEVDMSTFYFKTFDLISLNAIIVFSFLNIFSPMVSILWIGSYQPFFVNSVILLSVGWLFNIASAPAYFINMGTGDLKWNVISHIVLGLSNLILGVLLGKLFGGIAVIIGVTLSLVSSALITILSFHKKNQIQAVTLFKKSDIIFITTAIVLVVASLMGYQVVASGSMSLVLYYTVLAFVVFIFLFLGVFKTKTLSELYFQLPRKIFKRAV